MLKCPTPNAQYAQMLNCSIAKWSNGQLPNAQMLKCQMLECSNAQMFKCSNAQMLKCQSDSLRNLCVCAQVAAAYMSRRLGRDVSARTAEVLFEAE